MNSERDSYTQMPLRDAQSIRMAARYDTPPQPGKAQRRKQDRWLAIAMLGVIPVLFIISLFVPFDPLRLAFLVLAALLLGVMWLLRAFNQNARATISVAYVALCVIIGLAWFISANPIDQQVVYRRTSYTTSTTPGISANGSFQSDKEPTELPETEKVDAAQARLEEFLKYWSQNNIPAMLQLCASSWIELQQSPEQQLWNLMMNRYPVRWEVESIQGSEAYTSRTISVKVWITQAGSSDIQLIRMQVVMLRTNNVWYVDPRSLGGTEVNEEAEAQAKIKPVIASTKAPATATPSPQEVSSQVLWYNEDGGSYYHTSKTCSAVSESFWPLTGHFYVSELNSEPYNKLKPCTVCNPPTR